MIRSAAPALVFFVLLIGVAAAEGDVESELVPGLRLNGETAAYPLARLNENPVVNDRVGGTPAVITWIRESRSAFVFAREHNQIELTFEAAWEKGELYYERQSNRYGMERHKRRSDGGACCGQADQTHPRNPGLLVRMEQFLPPNPTMEQRNQ